MFERFTEDARNIIVLAQREARALNHNYIGSEHLLQALILDLGIVGKALSPGVANAGTSPPRAHIPGRSWRERRRQRSDRALARGPRTRLPRQRSRRPARPA